MRSLSIKRLVFTGCLAIALFAPAGATAAEPGFGGLVVFGTSLSDPGNAFALRGGTNTPPYDTLDMLLIPDAPYTKGGHHFSNGATWIEQFARSSGLAESVRPAYQGSNDGAHNYAVGGARAREDGKNVNLPAQVAAFLGDVGGAGPSDALYVIEIGGNDVRDAMAAFAAGADGSAIIRETLASVAANITTLYAAGARTFLVWNSPDIGLTPALRALDRIMPGAGQLAGHLTLAYNSGLDGLVATLEGLPGIVIKRFDAYRTLNDVVAEPAAFGFVNAESACVAPNDPPFQCQAADDYLFWDGIHPTQAGHAVLAQEAVLVLLQQ